jgi:outer membrane protein assembly factor BamB
MTTPTLRKLLQNSGRALPLVLLAVVSTVPADDWPQYRGSNHDGISLETIRTNWRETPPRQVWKIPLQPGFSSFCVSGGKAFTQVRRRIQGQNQEVTIALDIDTGKELWATPLDAADYPDGGAGEDDGPRSTPSVEGSSIFILTSYLKLACLDAADGHVVWSKDLVAEYGGTVISWQNAASPLLEGGLIFLNCNASNRRLLALRQADGGEVWKGQNDTMTQASPIAATMAGQRQIIFLTKPGLVSVIPETGAVLWRYSFSYSTSTGASPVAGGDMVYCSAAYGVGAGAVRISGSGTQLTAKEAWRSRGDKMNHWATPIHHQGYLYGIYGQESSSVTLRCIELATGAEQWRQGGVGAGGVLFTTGLVLVLTEDGYLVLVNPDPADYSEVARYRALNGSSSSMKQLPVKCWNVPAISNGRLYVRSTTEAVCLDVAGAAPPPPALRLSAALSNNGATFRIRLENHDQSPLNPIAYPESICLPPPI